MFDSNLWNIRPFFLILQLAHKVFSFPHSFICLEGTKDATYNLTALFFISLTSHNTDRSRSKIIHTVFVLANCIGLQKWKKQTIIIVSFNPILLLPSFAAKLPCVVPHKFILILIFSKKARKIFLVSGNNWSKLSDNLIAWKQSKTIKSPDATGQREKYPTNKMQFAGQTTRYLWNFCFLSKFTDYVKEKLKT